MRISRKTAMRFRQLQSKNFHLEQVLQHPSRNEGRLIDRAIRESYRKRSLVPAEFRERLIRARKFVLDEQMSGFLADLANAAITESLLRRRDSEEARTLLDGARRMARAPYPTTWIEYDCRARQRRAREAYSQNFYGDVADPEEICPAVGWLIEQHPGIEAAYKMTEFVQMIDSASHATEPVPMPYAYTWVADDTLAIPWQAFGFSEQGRRPSEVATGMMGYITDLIGFTTTETTERWPKKELVEQLKETMGELRCVFMLLASLNHIPTTYDHVRPQRGYVAKGAYRRFMEHSVIHLTLPAHRTLKTLAMRVLVHARRRGHEVRGFWRNDWRHPRTPGCSHVWINHDEHTLICQHCQGRRVWIRAHHRGDDSLGYVTHDYSVEKGTA